MATMEPWRRALLFGLCAVGVILLVFAASRLAVALSRSPAHHPPAASRPR